jgi:hypothetical protein
MRIMAVLLVGLISAGTASAARPHRSGGSRGTTHVRGYTTQKGTHVPSHRRTTPDSSKRNNWSSKGNVNPDTGKAGTKSP